MNYFSLLLILPLLLVGVGITSVRAENNDPCNYHGTNVCGSDGKCEEHVGVTPHFDCTSYDKDGNECITGSCPGDDSTNNDNENDKSSDRPCPDGQIQIGGPTCVKDTADAGWEDENNDGIADGQEHKKLPCSGGGKLVGSLCERVNSNSKDNDNHKSSSDNHKSKSNSNHKDKNNNHKTIIVNKKTIVKKNNVLPQPTTPKFRVDVILDKITKAEALQFQMRVIVYGPHVLNKPTLDKPGQVVNLGGCVTSCYTTWEFTAWKVPVGSKISACVWNPNTGHQRCGYGLSHTQYGPETIHVSVPSSSNSDSQTTTSKPSNTGTNENN